MNKITQFKPDLKSKTHVAPKIFYLNNNTKYNKNYIILS